MKGKTWLIAGIGLGLVLLGALVGAIGWRLSGDPLGELEGLSFSNTQFAGGRQLDSDFHADGIYTAEAATKLDLNWVAGAVAVRTYEGDGIRFAETADQPLTEENCLRWGVIEDTLYIQYCQKDTPGKLPDKSLEVWVPAELTLERLHFDGVSADLNLQEMTIENVEASATSGNLMVNQLSCSDVTLSSTSGDVTFDGISVWITANTTSGDVTVMQRGSQAYCFADTTSGRVDISGTFHTVEVNTTSGDVTVSGSLEDCDVSTTSGDVQLQGSPASICVSTGSGEVELDSDSGLTDLEVDGGSGDVTLTLPADCGFTLEYDTGSGSLDSRQPLQIQGDDRYICGDGTAQICISTGSGDLKIDYPD